MRRHIFIFLILSVLSVARKAEACTYFDSDCSYFNLFAQEIINDKQYMPFLMTEESRFYPSNNSGNANIKEWQEYLGLSYDDTYYLVFKASRDHINALLNGKDADDKKLHFITKDFVQRHRQALLYLAYAKYMEPFMRIVHEENEDAYWGYYSSAYSDYEEASKLDYEKVTTVLTRSWKAEKDKELKLRYGYQLVRFAHYNRKYEDAVNYFRTYVEPLNYKPEMYYYALSQKAGALRGMGKIIQANADFMKVFSYSSDLKENAYSSIYLNYDSEFDLNEFLSQAKTDNERNDVYLLLGYKAFNNPLNEIRKIVSATPDAIQAKVLMVRAINAIERAYIPISSLYTISPENKKYPVTKNDNIKTFLNDALTLSSGITQSAKEKDFWNMTTSYLHFLNKDFSRAKEFLSQVNAMDEIYGKQRRSLAAYIDICEQTSITGQVEIMLYERYRDLLSDTKEYNSNGWFLKNVLANRYFLQKEYAKSFLMTNKINALEMNPQENLLNHIEQFYHKENKNNFEKWLAESFDGTGYDTKDYFNYLHGIIRITNQDFEAAKRFFLAANDNFRLVSGNIFGYNIREWFSGEEDSIMRRAYISEFPFIIDNLSHAEVSGCLMELQQIGKKSNEKAAKANYLIGNFYYNVSSTGYFRQYLRFDNDNGFYYSKYTQFSEDETGFVYEYSEDSPKNTFYIDYEQFVYYKNTTAIAESYLQKALEQAKDKELKARILFSLAKVDQERLASSSSYYSFDSKTYYSKTYFHQLKELGNTGFHNELRQHCKYFNYYVNNN